MDMHSKSLGFVLLTPVLIALIITQLFPLLYTLYLSMFEITFITDIDTAPFKPLSNYEKVLTDPDFWNSFLKTIIWTVGSVVGAVIVGMSAALAINHLNRGQSYLLMLLTFPYVLPVVSTAIVWKWMFNDIYGVINYLIRGLHMTPILWFSYPSSAMFTSIFVFIWIRFPFVMLWTYAALQTIPRELYEAASVDGASVLQRFWHITLPSIKGVILGVILIRVMWTFNFFDLVFLLTGGGPGDGTMILPVYLYDTAFGRFQLSYASAMSIVMLFIMVIFVICYTWKYKRERISK
jgi:multiple sugar transport system permease protein